MLESNAGRVAGPWPDSFPVLPDGKVREGLKVRSLSGAIEGRTTGARRPCITKGCPGWFIGVRWETGQLMHICSEGWAYDPATESVRVTGGGEVSARFVAPKPLGTLPLPREKWPSRQGLSKWAGWRSESAPPRIGEAAPTSPDGHGHGREPLGHPTDAEIEAHLRSIPATAWRTFDEHLQAIAHLNDSCAWQGGTRCDGTHQMPYVVYSGPVDAVTQWLYDNGAVIAFDWMAWDGVERLRDAGALASAGAADVLRWLTALVRSERFGDGSIARCLDDGTLLAALHRLLRLGAKGGSTTS